MNLELLCKIRKISLELQGDLQKTGKGYKHKYFSTEDIIPKVLEKCEKYNIMYNISFTDKTADLRIIDCDNENSNSQYVHHSLPITALNDNTPEKTIQLVGKMQTYYTRYLLIQAFGICESDLIEMEATTPQKKRKKIIDDTPRTEDLDDSEFERMVKIVERNTRMGTKTPGRVIDELENMGKINNKDKVKLENHFKLGGVTM